MVTFGRIEYLTSAGWVNGHAGINLVDPQRYVDGLKVHGRFTEIDEDFLPGKVILPTTEKPVGGVPVAKIRECSACQGQHDTPWECLL